MHRVTRLLAVACVATALLARPDAAVGLDFNFNSDAGGFTFGTILGSGTETPYWMWTKAPSKDAGGLQAYLSASGSNAGAWALSPCFDVKPNANTIEIDLSHYTLFSSDNILGQVQFRLDISGTSGWGPWQGVDASYWKQPTSHVPPTASDVFPPLLSSTTTLGGSTNIWLAFSGTNLTSGTTPQGPHVLSGFVIPTAALGVTGSSEFQFRLLLGVNDAMTSSGTTPIWEVNSIDVKSGLDLCAAVPEPAALALAGSAAVVVLARLASRRGRPRRGPHDARLAGGSPSD